VLGRSGEVLGDITRLSDFDSGVVSYVLFRGFAENGHDVIWCNACTARHEQGDNSDDAGSGNDDAKKYAEEDDRGGPNMANGRGRRRAVLNGGKLLSTHCVASMVVGGRGGL